MSELGRYEVCASPPSVIRRRRPGVRLVVQAGLVVQEKDRASYPDQSVFIDGVYDGPPMLDNQRRHYVIDHHVGVVRAFTLASCEQAAVLLAGGLPIGEGTWHLYVNEPDLDAMLSAWLLLNHDRLVADDHRLLWDVMPLVRVEGVIDAHGLDMGVVSGLRPRVYTAHRSRLEELRMREIELRKTGAWRVSPLVDYAAEQLELLDRRLLQLDQKASIAPSEPGRTQSVEWRRRRIAVLYQGEYGIYELERDLKKMHGRALALIVLDRGNGFFTLLQVDPFLPKSLADVYPILNEEDPAVDRESGNTWGGSSDIGGSPRATGSALTGEQVLRLASDVFAVEPRE